MTNNQQGTKRSTSDISTKRPDYSLPYAIQDFETRALRPRLPMICLFPWYIIGPWIGDQEMCWDCYLGRLRQHQQNVFGTKILERTPTPEESLMPEWLHLVLDDVVKYLKAHPHPTQYIVNIVSGAIATANLTGLPFCTRCSPKRLEKSCSLLEDLQWK